MIILSLVSLLTFSGQAIADGKSHEESKSVSLQGEIVDMGCYLGHGATGEGHKSCALKCIAGGMPMGLLLEDGSLYLLTMSHSDADPFDAAKEMAAQFVEITGPVYERNGVKALEVGAVKLTGGTRTAIYTCPMHPEVMQDGPGKCPKCQMALVPGKTKK